MPSTTKTEPPTVAGPMVGPPGSPIFAAGGRLQMITLTVERRYGTATVRSRVTAPSIGRALELCGEDARIVLLAQTERLLLAARSGGSSKNPSEREPASKVA